MKIKTAYFEITNICNLNCQTCYNRSGLTKNRFEISAPRLRNSIDILLGLGLQRVLLSGGEPLLHSALNHILDVVEAYPALSFGIVTNGTIHSQRLIDKVNAGELTLQISLDGSSEAQNAKTRGAGHFEEALAFAKQIKIPVQKPLLKMVVSQNNLEDISAFYRLAVSLGFLPEFSFIYKSGNGREGWESKALTPQQKLKVLHQIETLNLDWGTEALLPLCTHTCPYTHGTESMSVCIKADGTIQPCQTFYDSKFALGNIFDFKLNCFTERVGEFTALARRRAQQDYGCRKCIIKDYCGKGCLAIAHNLNGEPLASDGDCSFRKLLLLKGIKK